MKRKKIFLYIGFIVVMLSMTIGFSLIATNLDVTGDVTVKSQTWDLYFSNVRSSDDSKEASRLVIDVVNPTQVNYAVSLEHGEKFEFLVDANNQGTLTALIGSISNDLSDYSGNLSYSISYLNGSSVAVDQPLYVSNIETYKVTILYNGADNGLINVDSNFNIKYTYGNVVDIDMNYSLVGTVYDINGVPLDGGYIVIDDVPYNINSNGAYVVNNLSAGEHIVEIKDLNNNLLKSDTFSIHKGTSNSIVDNIITSSSYLGMNVNILITDTEMLFTKEPVVAKFKCKRATKLHTEECIQTDSIYYCSGAGYTTSGLKGTTTITYGNLGEKGKLTSGDAFDCDVNGDGKYDKETERFYYVSDLYNTTKKDFDSDYAVLIYYSNTNLGVVDNSVENLISYDKSNENWHGPVTAITNLPTINQWSNVSLSNSFRAIITEQGTTATIGGTLPAAFSYTGYSARLLTVQELEKACGITVGSLTVGELDTCNYLMENTKYSSDSMGVYRYWLETPHSSNSYVWFMLGSARYVSYTSANYESDSGIRPVIEVLKTDIEI